MSRVNGMRRAEAAAAAEKGNGPSNLYHFCRPSGGEAAESADAKGCLLCSSSCIVCVEITLALGESGRDGVISIGESLWTVRFVCNGNGPLCPLLSLDWITTLGWRRGREFDATAAWAKGNKFEPERGTQICACIVDTRACTTYPLLCGRPSC